MYIYAYPYISIFMYLSVTIYLSVYVCRVNPLVSSLLLLVSPCASNKAMLSLPPTPALAYLTFV